MQTVVTIQILIVPGASLSLLKNEQVGVVLVAPTEIAANHYLSECGDVVQTRAGSSQMTTTLRK